MSDRLDQLHGDGASAPCLFLSHSGADTEAARELKRRILESPEARDARLTVWFDKDDLAAGRDWQEQIEVAITRQATAFAVYVGSKGVMNWVEREVRLGLARATGADAIRFVPILAQAVAPAAIVALPPFAQQHQAVADPLGHPAEFSKLMTAILGRSGEQPARLTDEPFVGLRAMTEREADRFFGRESEVAELVDDVRRNRLVAIVADSGAGKSSLAMAGLAPAFRGGALADPARREPNEQLWHVVVMRPGGDPLEGLKRGVTEAAERMGLSPDARAGLRRRLSLDDANEAAYALRCDLPANTTETLLIVDQFDELLTETAESARAPFIDFLLHLAARRGPGGFHVVLTVRVDYFNLCRPFEALYNELQGNERVLRLKRISDAGLEEAVRAPLRMAGFSNESEQKALANEMRRDLGDRPGDLALAQMALWTVWRNRRAHEGSLLRAYFDVGRVSGALAQEAERIRTQKLNEAERTLLPALFVRLVRLGETGGVLRRLAGKDEFDDARRALADKLASDEYGRLLLVSEARQAENARIEVCHEALITQWPWLQNTLNAAAADLRALERLMDRAARWCGAPDAERDKYLATGAERELFIDLRGQRDEWFSGAEREFIKASETAFASEEKAKRDKDRRLRVFTAALGVAVFGLLGLVWLAFHYVGVARQQEQIAKESEALARANQTAALAGIAAANVNTNPTRAIKLALAAWPRRAGDPKPRLSVTLAALSAAVVQSRERKILDGHDGAVVSAAFSPDGTRVVTASWDKTARLWDAATGKEIAVLRGHDDAVLSAAFSPDGTRVVTASVDSTARLWDAGTGKEIDMLRGHNGFIWSAAFSPDGTRVVTASADKTARLWDAATGSEISVLSGHDDVVQSAAFSPDGTRVVTASNDKTARLWDAASGRVIAVLRGHDGDVTSAVFSPDGTRVVTASADKTARLWDEATGREIAVLRGHDDAVNSAAFSPDGTHVITAGDNTARLWGAATGPPIAVLRDDWVWSAAFSPDGKRVVTASLDSTAQLWDVASGKEIAVLRGHDGGVRSAAFSPDGTRVVTASFDGTARLWDAGTGKEIEVLRGHDGYVWGATFSPDGTRVVTASLDDTARLWDAATGKEIAVLNGHEGSVQSAAFSPDGTRVVTASHDKTARLWDAATGKEIAVLSGHDDYVRSAAFSPDGTRVVTTSSDKTARLWDAASGKSIAVLRGHNGSVESAAFSPDGTRVVTASADKTARLWDSASGQPITVLSGHDNVVWTAAFSPDGTRVVTASQDKTARIWDINTIPKGNLFQIACAWLPDHDLTDIARDYGLTNLEPICEGDPPLPDLTPQ